MADDVFRDPDVIRADIREARHAISLINGHISSLMSDRRWLEDKIDDLHSELEAQGADILTDGQLAHAHQVAQEMDEEARAREGRTGDRS